jgi:hypothetical protein
VIQNFLNDVRGNILKNCKYYHSTEQTETLNGNRNPNTNSYLHLNIRSIPKNLDTFITTLHSINMEMDVIAFTETWLKASNADCYGMNGYTHEYITREGRPGGGISIFVNETWIYKVRHDLTIKSEDYDMLWLEIDKDSTKTAKNVIIGTIYRRPGSSPLEFNQQLQDTLLELANEQKEIIHMGDYNLNLLSSDTHIPTNEFIEINFEQSLFPSINKPTRISNSSATLIDNIFTSASLLTNSTSGILTWDISDHFPVFLIVYNNIPVTEETFKMTRSHCQKNKQAFTDAMAGIDWTTITSCSNAQQSYTNFHSIMSTEYNRAFPLKRQKLGYINKHPWVTEGLKMSIKRKHKLHPKCLKHPSPGNIAEYKKFKNKLTHVMRVMERNYIQKELCDCKKDMRKSWRIIKEIVNKNAKRTQKLPKITINGNLVDNPLLIAEGFNKIFTNIGPTLDKKIPISNVSPLHFIPKNYTINLFLSPTSETEINKIVDNLKNCAVG